MKILVVTNLYPPRVLGGYELAAEKIVAGLRGRGHDVRVLTSPAWQPVREEGVERTLALRAYQRVAPTSSSVNTLFQYESKASQLDNTLVLLAALRRHRPDRVLVFNVIGLGGIALLDLVRRSGVPWVWNLGDRVPGVLLEDLDPELLAPLEPGAAFASGSASVVSRTLASEIADEGVALGPVEVIPRGVRPHGIVRGRDYRAGGVTRFTAASVLTEFKGVGLIVDAAARLRREGRTFEVTVFGSGDVEAWRRRAEEAGVGDVVRFPGFVGQRELVEAHAEADAFLFPTWGREPGASAPFEAASVGAVPIVTRDCGPAESLHDGVDSLLIDRDVDALASAMRAVVDGDVDLASLGAAGIALTSGPLAADTSLERLEKFLRETGADRPDRVDDPALDEHVLDAHDRVVEGVAARIRADEDAWARSLAPAPASRALLRRGIRRPPAN